MLISSQSANQLNATQFIIQLIQIVQIFSMDIFRQHLKELSFIRLLLLSVLWIAWLASWWVPEVAHLGISIMLLVLSVIAVLSSLRCKNPEPVTEREFFAQLLIDVLGFIGLFYFSGGANNPFISYLLVPISLAAATLNGRFTGLIAGLSVIAYSLLLFLFIDLPLFSPEHQHHTQRWNWHILGMWLNFFISAGLITYFMLQMSQSLRLQNKLIQELREDELRNEQLIGVALLAAGAAHEMNTPLSTMKIVLTDLRKEFGGESKNGETGKSRKVISPALDLDAELKLLEQQLWQCADILKHLVQDASGATQGKFKKQSLREFCDALLDRWQLLRPQAKFSFQFDTDDFEREVQLDPRLQQALINLLNNAADATQQAIQILFSCSATQLHCKIIDDGQGIADNLRQHLGKKPQTTKENGLGLGLVLTHATIKACGGQVQQTNLTPQGTLTEITIPLL